MKLALDHHYSPLIAEVLRERGFDVIAVAERAWQEEDDEPLLALCGDEQRALVTNNVADFAPLARAWALEGRSHCGLIFTSDASLPRARDTIGRYVDALASLAGDHPKDDGFTDRIHWL